MLHALGETNTNAGPWRNYCNTVTTSYRYHIRLCVPEYILKPSGNTYRSDAMPGVGIE